MSIINNARKKGIAKQNLRVSQKNKASPSNLASVAEGTENILSESTSLVSVAWIDFGCSHCMRPNQEWFAISKTVDGVRYLCPYGKQHDF